MHPAKILSSNQILLLGPIMIEDTKYQAWDPCEVFGLTIGDSIQCHGQTLKPLKCRNVIGTKWHSDIEIALANLSSLDSGKVVEKTLIPLAHSLLCVRNHRDSQESDLASIWYKDLQYFTREGVSRHGRKASQQSSLSAAAAAGSAINTMNALTEQLRDTQKRLHVEELNVSDLKKQNQMLLQRLQKMNTDQKNNCSQISELDSQLEIQKIESGQQSEAQQERISSLEATSEGLCSELKIEKDANEYRKAENDALHCELHEKEEQITSQKLEVEDNRRQYAVDMDKLEATIKEKDSLLTQSALRHDAADANLKHEKHKRALMERRLTDEHRRLKVKENFQALKNAIYIRFWKRQSDEFKADNETLREQQHYLQLAFSDLQVGYEQLNVSTVNGAKTYWKNMLTSLSIHCNRSD